MQAVSHLPRRRKAHPTLLPLLITLALIALLVIAFNVWGGQAPAARPIPAVGEELPINLPTPRAQFKATVIAPPAVIASPSTLPLEHKSLSPATLDEMPIAADQIVAQINGAILTTHDLQVIVDADRAIATLLNSPINTAPTVALERLVNGELVRQAAQKTNFTLDPSMIAQSLQAFLVANQSSTAALEAALAEVSLTRTDFDAYFANLLLVDRFSRMQSQQLGLSGVAYLQKLQQDAHISFGTAATPLLTQSTSTLAPFMPQTAPAVDAAQPVSMRVRPSTAEPVAAMNDAVRGTNIGDYAPLFTLPLATTSSTPSNTLPLTLEGLAGQPTVLSFWTSWCPYCLRQTPILVAAAAEAGAAGIHFAGVNVREEQATVQSYMTTHAMNYPIGLDSDGQIATTYGVTGFPTTYFLDAQGRIIARHVGALTAEKLTEYLQQITIPN